MDRFSDEQEKFYRLRERENTGDAYKQLYTENKQLQSDRTALLELLGLTTNCIEFYIANQGGYLLGVDLKNLLTRIDQATKEGK